MYCPRCGLRQPEDHRYCAKCGHRLPAELLRPEGPKVSRWFRTIPVHPVDDPAAMLRVSRYLEEFEMASPEGTVRIPSHHVRFSIWSEDRTLHAVSIPDDEARALAEFLMTSVADERGSQDAGRTR